MTNRKFASMGSKLEKQKHSISGDFLSQLQSCFPSDDNFSADSTDKCTFPLWVI